MPEQSVHHQEETDPEQHYNNERKGEQYENDRHHRTGRIQRRN